MRLTHDVVSGGSEEQMRHAEPMRTKHDDVAGSFGGDPQNLAMSAADRHHSLHARMAVQTLGNHPLQSLGTGVSGGRDVRAECPFFEVGPNRRGRRHLDHVDERQVRPGVLHERERVLQRPKRRI